jgi:hypothetical protein
MRSRNWAKGFSEYKLILNNDVTLLVSVIHKIITRMSRYCCWTQILDVKLTFNPSYVSSLCLIYKTNKWMHNRKVVSVRQSVLPHGSASKLICMFTAQYPPKQNSVTLKKCRNVGTNTLYYTEENPRRPSVNNASRLKLIFVNAVLYWTLLQKFPFV